jgi:hypothetical protein
MFCGPLESCKKGPFQEEVAKDPPQRGVARQEEHEDKTIF